eukprot:4547948-Alexandrium_andersonii.AAC.1
MSVSARACVRARVLGHSRANMHTRARRYGRASGWASVHMSGMCGFASQDCSSSTRRSSTVT